MEGASPKPLSLENYNTVPRVTGLVLSPDGRRLVMPVQSLSADGKRFVTALWELAADGSSEPRRLTYSEKGEASPAFLPDGSLVFSSARPDPGVKEDEADGRLWLLPAAGGEALPLAALPGGVEGVVAAREAATVAVVAPLYPDAAGLEADAEKAKKRKEADVSPILFDGYPIRYWDHELGPRRARLLRMRRDGGWGAAPDDLTSDAGGALMDAEVAISPDGQTVVTTWRRTSDLGFVDTDLVAVGRQGRRTLATGADYGSPAISPDGRWVVAVRERRGTPALALDLTLWLIDLESGEERDLTPELDLWPASPAWAPDSSALYFVADDHGHGPLFRVELESGVVRRMTGEGVFSSPCPHPDGRSVLALRSSYGSPAEVVRVDEAGEGTALPTPGLPLDLPGVVTEVTAQADDGVALRAWLVLPREASERHPVPLVVWVHGGPLSSWNAWSWRWCPHLLAERGYAVLLPDPALSTGYGHAFVQRSWGRWGQRTFTDVMTMTDAALQRPDIDASRTAEMGGSFGGYMSNWIAGHTDRFKAIVTHASLWSMEQFHGTTDLGTLWEHELGDPYRHPTRWIENSPSRHVANIRTPMLIVHGLRDYRVPISEALKMWTDLRRHGVPARFLFFPDENHWILKPGNVTVWYQTVLAFLDQHVLGKPWEQPDLL